MPIYEYACLACDHQFEKIQKMSDAPIRKCPACGKLKAKRLISRSAFVLKGAGWYVTDYPSQDRKAAMKAESDNGGSTKTSETSSKGQETSKSKETSKGKDSSSGKETSKSKTQSKAKTKNE